MFLSLTRKVHFGSSHDLGPLCFSENALLSCTANMEGDTSPLLNVE